MHRVPAWARAAVAFVCFATGCSSVRLPAPDGNVEGGVSVAQLEARLAAIAFPVLTAAAEWCPYNHELTYGFLLQVDGDAGTYSEGEDGLTSNIVVQYVHPKFPAALAGLHVGARILAVNGEPTAGKTVAEVMQLVHKAALARIQPLTLSVERGGGTSEVNVDGVMACRFSIHLVASGLVNAFADGTRMLLTTGMLRFAVTDDELAFVLAHEIAHNALEHSQTMRLRSVLDDFIAATTGEHNANGSAVPRWSMEAQADYLGMYIVARAGFDIRSAGDFWRRILRLSPDETRTSFVLTHPNTPDRLAVFEITLQEIEGKMRRGESLRFNLGEEKAWSASDFSTQ